MSENIYEIAQMMQSEQNFNKDMSEAMELVAEHFQNKYMKRLKRAVQSHQQRIKDSPPKEVRLLHAMKPFFAESSHKEIDRAIDMMMMLHSTKSIQHELSTHRQASVTVQDKKAPIQNSDDTIHGDGIYDLDHACLSNKNNSSFLPGFLLLMAMTR